VQLEQQVSHNWSDWVDVGPTGLVADLIWFDIAVYTAYRDADTLFNSKDLATGVYDYWQKKGAANIAEVRRHMDLPACLMSCVRALGGILSISPNKIPQWPFCAGLPDYRRMWKTCSMLC